VTVPFQVDREIRGSFLIEKETVERLYAHIAALTTEPPLVAFTFRSGRKLRGTSIEELLADSLISSSALESIQIASVGSMPSVEVTLADRNHGPISLHLAGQRAQVLQIEENIANEAEAARAWYSSLNLNSYYGISFTNVMSVLLIIMVAGLLALYFTPNLVVKVSFGAFLAVYIPLVLLPVTVNILFPSLRFVFGRGARSYRMQRAVFGFLLIAVGVGFVVAVAANYASRELGI
jgi:hypothetical protein